MKAFELATINRTILIYSLSYLLSLPIRGQSIYKMDTEYGSRD